MNAERDESDLSHDAAVSDEDAEGLARELIRDGLGGRLERRCESLQIRLQERGGVEHRDLAPRLTLLHRGRLGPGGGPLRVAGAPVGQRGLPSRQRRERSRHHTHDERHHRAERDGRRADPRGRRGSGQPDRRQQLPDEERNRPDRRPGESPSRGALERHQVSDNPDGIRRTVGGEPDEQQDHDRVQTERGDADPKKLRGIGSVRGARDRDVPDREAHHEGHPERQHEPGVDRPVPDREPDLRGAERGHDPAQPDEPQLETSRVVIASHGSFPRRGPVRSVDTLGRRAARPAARDLSMFDTLTDRLDGVFTKLRKRGKLHPKQVDNALGDIRVALLEADVAVEVADDLLDRVRARALSEEVLKSLTPAQQVVKVMDEELTVTLGGEHRPFQLPGAPPAVVMMATLAAAAPARTETEKPFSDLFDGLQFRSIGPYRGGRSCAVSGHPASTSCCRRRSASASA